MDISEGRVREAWVCGMVRAQLMMDELEKISSEKLAESGPDEGQVKATKDERTTPLHEMMGVEIRGDKIKARGIPFINPPPGFVFDEDAVAVRPNDSDPRWQPENEALVNRSKRVLQGEQQSPEAAAPATPAEVQGELPTAQQGT